VLAATAMLGALQACSGDDDKSDAGNKEDVHELDTQPDGAGTCLDVPKDQGPDVDTLTVVECTVPHTHEIYAKLQYTTDNRDPDTSPSTTNVVDVFPGKQALDSFAEVRCFEKFEDFVGIGQFESRLHYSWIEPTLDSWNGKDSDQYVLCVLLDPTTEKMTQSMRNARI
jgi:hypothetical protein